MTAYQLIHSHSTRSPRSPDCSSAKEHTSLFVDAQGSTIIPGWFWYLGCLPVYCV